MSASTQNTRVLRYLQSGAELTALVAWRDLGIGRLAARIYELRFAGHPIESRTIHRADAKFAAYKLAKARA